jgi:hypothetical protein
MKIRVMATATREMTRVREAPMAKGFKMVEEKERTMEKATGSLKEEEQHLPTRPTKCRN